MRSGRDTTHSPVSVLLEGEWGNGDEYEKNGGSKKGGWIIFPRFPECGGGTVGIDNRYFLLRKPLSLDSQVWGR